MAATYEPIATTTLGANATTISFTSIPSTYTDLRICYTFIRGANAGNTVFLRFNSVSGTSYSQNSLIGDGSAAMADRYNATGQFRILDGQGTSTPSMGTVDIFSYAGSTNKSILFTYSGDRNGSGWVTYNVGLWSNTSAISSIELICQQTSGWGIGSTATLYGIKAA